MGIYISKPVTDKECSDEEFSSLRCGSSSMQGWRTSQEDAHNAILDFEENCSLFAVYDGHGGHEVAEYTALHFPAHLLANLLYKQGHMGKALVESFLTFDQHLLVPEVLAVLKKMAGSKKGEEADESTDSEDADIVSALRKDANMSIDDLIASRYAGKALAKLKGGESSDASPSINAKKCDTKETSSSSSLIADVDKKHEEETVGRGSSSISSCSNSNSSCASTNVNSKCSLTESNGENLPPKEESECNSDVPKEESLSPKAEKLTNGDTEKSSSNSGAEPAKPLTNGDTTEHKTENSVNGDAEENKSAQLAVEGRRIVPTMLSAQVSSKAATSPTYTGKGKSGGKGGKVKGKSAITTTTLPDQEPGTPKPEAPGTRGGDSKTRRAALAEAKMKVLSQEDLDSDDEDEDDENYAVDEDEPDRVRVDLGDDDNNDVDDDDDEEEENDEDDDDDDDDDDENSDDEEDSSEDGEEGAEEGTEEGDGGLECADDGDEEQDDEDDISAEDNDVYSEFYAKMPDGPGYDSGCTACVALLHKNKLYVANVGDSRCVLSRAGEAVDMSVDHKPEDDVETERIIKAGGKVTEDGRVNGGLNLSRALGDHGYKMNTKVPDTEQMISPLPDLLVKTLTKEDDFIIIACDGIWNSLTSQEAVDFVKERLANDPDVPLSSICNEMFEHCLAPDLGGDGTGCDNMTCIIVGFKDKSSFAEPGTEDEEQEELQLPSAGVGPQKPGVNGVAYQEMNGDDAQKDEPRVDSRENKPASDNCDDESDSGRSRSETAKNELKNMNSEVGSDVSVTKRCAESVEDDRPCKKLKIDSQEESSPVSV